MNGRSFNVEDDLNTVSEVHLPSILTLIARNQVNVRVGGKVLHPGSLVQTLKLIKSWS